MDDDLFSTILYLVPVAAILFFRVFAGAKKTRAAKDGKARELAARRELARRVRADLEAAGGPVPLSRISGREPESQEWEPHWVTEEDYPGPSAPRPVPPIPAVPNEEGPEAHERLAFLDSEGRPPAGKVAPAPGGVGVGRFDEYPVSGSGPSLLSPADLSDARAAEDARTAAGPFPGALESLPPLKRAVVMAEILGPPRGA